MGRLGSFFIASLLEWYMSLFFPGLRSETACEDRHETEIIAELARDMRQRHGLVYCGKLTGQGCEIFDFQVNKRVSLEEAREMEVDAMLSLHQIIERHRLPPQARGRGVLIAFRDRQGCYPVDGSIASVFSPGDHIVYKRGEKGEKRAVLVDILDEPWEEALKNRSK